MCIVHIHKRDIGALFIPCVRFGGPLVTTVVGYMVMSGLPKSTTAYAMAARTTIRIARPTITAYTLTSVPVPSEPLAVGFITNGRTLVLPWAPAFSNSRTRGHAFSAYAFVIAAVALLTA